VDNWGDWVCNDGQRDAVIQLAVLHLRTFLGQKRSRSGTSESVYIGLAGCQYRQTVALINENKP